MQNKIKTSSRNLKHYFTEDEKHDIGDALAKATQKKYSLEDDKKAVMDQFKSRISASEFDIKEQSLLLSNGYEFRDIECEVIRDFVKKEISFKRLDTNEIVDTRPMMAHELQQELPFHEKENDIEEAKE